MASDIGIDVDDFGYRCANAKDVFVTSKSLTDHGFSLPCRCEPFALKPFATKRSFVALGITNLPKRDGIDAYLDEPLFEEF